MSRPGLRLAPPGPTVTAAAAFVLSWLALPDVGFRDSGEIGTAAHALGVAHPTGFAVDLLFLRAASFLPLGSIAFRQNLCVALEAALALGLLAGLADRAALALGASRNAARWTGAALAACALLGWQTFAATAIGVEVYALALACALLALDGLSRGGVAAGTALIVIGFAPGLHVTAGLFALLGMLWFVPHRGARAGLRFVAVRLPVMAVCALVVSYLPLASLRQPVLDWGDPEDLSRLFGHLTAARIRGAFEGEMLQNDAAASLEVVTQWLELWPLAPFALLAVVVGVRRKPLAILAPLSLCAADLAYAVWVNPMGAGDRQVGHMAGAGLCMLGGTGAALSLGARARVARALSVPAVLVAFALIVLRAPSTELDDGFAASESVGSGGPLAALPPRAVLLCYGDDLCAVSLFALHVERVRPDVEVLPAQHLWDATVVRRLHGHPDIHVPLPGQGSPPVERGRAALAVLDALVNGQRTRPVLLESPEILRGLRERPAVALGAASEAPFIRVAEVESAGAAVEEQALARLDQMRRARFPSGMPRGERARAQWSRAYGTLGEVAVWSRPRFAARAFARAVEIAPSRPAAWSNLGAALDGAGDVDGALDASRRAIALDPVRPTPWVNLARFTLRRDGPAAAREVLRLAAAAGVHDARLDEIARAAQ
jgi:hypothetical protein